MICYTLMAISMMVLMCSCENKGPVSHASFPDRTPEETLNEIMDAGRRDGYFLKCSVELYYLNDGEWEYYGVKDIYTYANGNAGENNDWVEFNGELYPSYDTNKGGYRFCVTYNGVDYYFS